MWAICSKEFMDLFRSVKSLILIAFIFSLSYVTAEFMSGVHWKITSTSNKYFIGVSFIIYFLSFLMVTSLSHDTVNREITTRTVRFLITKAPRKSIIIGKFAGIWMFWVSCILLSFGLVSIIAKYFYWVGFLTSSIFIAAPIALTMLLSVSLKKPGLSMFIGIIFSIVFPIMSSWAMFTHNPWIVWFKYITPYFYTVLGGYHVAFVLLYAFLILVGVYAIFRKADL